MKVAFIGVPMALGADRIGVDKAPDCFRTGGAIEMINSIAGCYDLGNVNSSIIAENIHASSPEVKYLDTVVDMATQLRDKVASVIKQGYFPLIVGGDHSLGLGSGAGVAMSCDNPAIIWFDAHGDFNTEETSPSGNLHGMPCAALMGWCKSKLKDVAINNVPSRNIYWIGARDLDYGEVQLAKEHNLHIFPSATVKERGMNSVLNEIFEDWEKNNISQVHLSIDIDGMDPAIVRATGTRVDNGLGNGDFYTFIDKVFGTGKVISTDFVEYNPTLEDDNGTTLKWCMEALHYLSIKINQL